MLRLCADVRDALRDTGRVLVGEALKILPDAMPSRPLRLLVECSSPLSAQQRAFLEACPLISYKVRLAPGGGGIHRAPEGVLVRFAFPSGSYAEPATLRDTLCVEGREGALVACKEPLSLFEKLAPALAEAGLSCAVRAGVPFAQIDFGRAMLSLRRFLVSDAWRSGDLADYSALALLGVLCRGRLLHRCAGSRQPSHRSRVDNGVAAREEPPVRGDGGHRD